MGDVSLAIFGAAALGACLVLLAVALLDRRRLARALRHLRDRNERLGDEIWEVREAVEARQRAEAASEAKSRFLATVSHEIRTPLNGILGMASLIGGTRLDPEQHSYVEAIATSGRALAALIDDILDLSRIEAGRLDLAAERFELLPLVEGVVELLAPRAQDKGLEIASFVAPDLAAIFTGDPIRLRQVLTNLAGNAVKFTETGGVGVSVTAGVGGALRFAVSDTGPGVPPERRQAVFEDFEQGDGTATRRHGGSGLGLAISRRIVEGMGGDLVLDDRPGGGSIFSFEVALAPRDEALGIPLARPDLRGREVLIAASSPFQAAFLARELELAGASVVREEDPDGATRTLERRPAIDILLVDCALGREATARLAEAARRAGVARRYLLFSPFERRAFGQSLVSGFDGWLVKPVRARSSAAMLAGGLPPPSAAPEEPRPSEAKGRRPLRVLLAEDNDINAMVATTALRRLGVEVVRAAGGAAALGLALDALHGGRPAFDTILMDVSMPELDGMEVTRRLRGAEREAGTPRTRVVALTAHAFADERDAFLAAGMDDVLTKPLDFDRLAALLSVETSWREAV